MHQDTEKPRAAARLIAHFERQILDGTLPEGATLPPEREIVAEHGVSRTVVREAVLALSNKGLVRARPRFRPVVVRPGYDTALEVVGSVVAQLLGQPGGVRNLFDTRILMEASLVRHAALSATAQDIQTLKSALADNEAAIDDSTAFYRTDTAFHGVLYDIPANPVLPAIHAAYTDWLSVHWLKMPRLPDRNRTNFRSHAAIFDAILHRDPDLAEAALRAHLADAWEQVSDTFDKP